jgi:hypothetical protein
MEILPFQPIHDRETAAIDDQSEAEYPGDSVYWLQQKDL